jgi:hypothetical protein
MRRLAFLGLLCGAAALAYACGGSTTDIDGGADSGSDSTTGNDSGGSDAATDAGADVSTDAGGCDACSDYVTTDCDAGCPANTVCVTRNQGVQVVSGCYPLPACACSGKSACECIGSCVCSGPGSTCQAGNNGITCTGGAISRREFKTDITYVDDAERASLASQALETRLAEYRYKTEPDGHKRHLGFIIDDMPNASPAVQADRTHVDLYGYTSMLLATVQEQQRQIDDLKQQVADLKKR